MPLSAEQKKAIIEEHARKDGDTGSPEVQIALLNARISYLTEHARSNRKDHHSRYGLIKLVGKQRRLLAYLRRTDRQCYDALIKELGLRDRFAIRSS
ncbi:TPA: 30S ribosomal protein S15 [Candidatus Poribacteria bacterium]|nr:30S ribosomal protein S15 [Candidatus Poribacteria bacterium]